jgi:malate synthase
MTVPFMRAYTNLLVQTCRKRGAQAIGGMSAFIPDADERTNEIALAAVAADKQREAADGFDGSWVAHPALVPICRRAFDAVSAASSPASSRGLAPGPSAGLAPGPSAGRSPWLASPVVRAADLLAVDETPGQVTSAGVRGNVAVALRYFDAWLAGTGAAAINHLMEDAATAEIARCQLWQWIHHGTPMADGGRVTTELVRAMLEEEAATLGCGRCSVEVFEEHTLAEDLPAFFTTGAYAKHLTSIER